MDFIAEVVRQRKFHIFFHRMKNAQFNKKKRNCFFLSVNFISEVYSKKSTHPQHTDHFYEFATITTATSIAMRYKANFLWFYLAFIHEMATSISSISISYCMTKSVCCSFFVCCPAVAQNDMTVLTEFRHFG